MSNYPPTTTLFGIHIFMLRNDRDNTEALGDVPWNLAILTKARGAACVRTGAGEVFHGDIRTAGMLHYTMYPVFLFVLYLASQRQGEGEAREIL